MIRIILILCICLSSVKAGWCTNHPETLSTEIESPIFEVEKPSLYVSLDQTDSFWTENVGNGKRETTFVENCRVRTNLPAWLMLWMNVAAEYDFSKHWSVSLPVYYSGFNYFRSDVKFRTFSVVPEVRYWLTSKDKGMFINAHAGLAYFDYAKGGDYRYQDHNRKTPALGGGIGFGWRFPLGNDSRWSMEAGVGAGIYHLDYDVFLNRHNGLIVERKKRTFFGIDQAALSLVYNFGKTGKGGGR